MGKALDSLLEQIKPLAKSTQALYQVPILVGVLIADLCMATYNMACRKYEPDTLRELMEFE